MATTNDTIIYQVDAAMIGSGFEEFGGDEAALPYVVDALNELLPDGVEAVEVRGLYNGARNSEDAQWAVDERTWLAALDLAYDRMAAEA